MSSGSETGNLMPPMSPGASLHWLLTYWRIAPVFVLNDRWVNMLFTYLDWWYTGWGGGRGAATLAGTGMVSTGSMSTLSSVVGCCIFFLFCSRKISLVLMCLSIQSCFLLLFLCTSSVTVFFWDIYTLNFTENFSTKLSNIFLAILNKSTFRPHSIHTHSQTGVTVGFWRVLWVLKEYWLSGGFRTEFFAQFLTFCKKKR